eukprot:UN06141
MVTVGVLVVVWMSFKKWNSNSAKQDVWIIHYVSRFHMGRHVFCTTLILGEIGDTANALRPGTGTTFIKTTDSSGDNMEIYNRCGSLYQW